MLIFRGCLLCIHYNDYSLTTYVEFCVTSDSQADS